MPSAARSTTWGVRPTSNLPVAIGGVDYAVTAAAGTQAGCGGDRRGREHASVALGYFARGEIVGSTSVHWATRTVTLLIVTLFAGAL